jgi:uncharacterized membrane protein YccC
MLKKSLIVFPMVLFLSSTAFPQGKGGGMGGSRGQGQGQGGQTTGQGQGQGSQTTGQGQGQSSGQSGNTQMDRIRVKSTTQQRDQIQSCEKQADAVRKQARTMAEGAGKKLNAGQLNQQQSHIQNQIKQMEQDHQRLMSGLDATQKQAWQDQIKNMDRLHQQLNTQQQQMDGELKGNPDAKRVADQAREMERTMNEWQKQYSVLASQAE